MWYRYTIILTMTSGKVHFDKLRSKRTSAKITKDYLKQEEITVGNIILNMCNIESIEVVKRYD